MSEIQFFGSSRCKIGCEEAGSHVLQMLGLIEALEMQFKSSYT
jgi:hypothetical protein